MKNIKFTETELQYINAAIDDPHQLVSRTFNAFFRKPFLTASFLSKGNYRLAIEDPQERITCVNELLHRFNMPAHATKYGVEFTILYDTLISLPLTDIESNVISLRKQDVLNRRKFAKKQETLIQKDIKTRTDLGEEYNRQSFEDTILDYFNDDENLIVDHSKSIKDPDIRYLQLMKLMQDKNRYEIKQQKLDMEAMELAIREQNLMKY